jgi:hypothetical protein
MLTSKLLARNSSSILLRSLVLTIFKVENARSALAVETKFEQQKRRLHRCFMNFYLWFRHFSFPCFLTLELHIQPSSF